VVSTTAPTDEHEHQSEAEPDVVTAEAPEDVLTTYSKAAIANVAQDKILIDRIRTNGIPWRGVVDALEHALPDILDDRNKIAYDLVREFMDDIFGVDKWQTERRPSKSGSGMTTWIVLKK
jgi:hypothetical protein